MNKNNSNPPLVSIMCEVFNHGAFLQECLNGFVMQETDFKYEVLIHDDASTDRSQEIIREYEQKYPGLFKPIYQTENQYSKGISVWLKHQFPRVTGKYVAFCEGDDCWTDPTKLQRQIDFMENHPDYSLCFHTVTEHFEDGSKADRPHWIIENRDYSTKEIYHQWVIQTASAVMRSDVIDSPVFHKMFYEVKPFFGDTPLFLTCSMCGKVRGMDNVMSLYRRHGNNLTNNNNFSNEKFLIRFANYHMRLYQVFGNDFKDKAINEYVTNYTAAFISSGKNKQLKWSYLLSAIRTSPTKTASALWKAVSGTIKRRLHG